MRAQQTGFGFDIFEMAGFTVPTVEDFKASEARRAAREREARERAEREARDRQEREQRRYSRSRSGSVHSHWETLGVRMGASQAEIRAAWVAACKRHHPDAGGDLETMKLINRAYSALKGK